MKRRDVVCRRRVSIGPVVASLKTDTQHWRRTHNTETLLKWNMMKMKTQHLDAPQVKYDEDEDTTLRRSSCEIWLSHFISHLHRSIILPHLHHFLSVFLHFLLFSLLALNFLSLLPSLSLSFHILLLGNIAVCVCMCVCVLSPLCPLSIKSLTPPWTAHPFPQGDTRHPERRQL